MRIASLQPSISLTLDSIGRLDALCACTRYCIEALPALGLRNLPILEDSWSFDKPGNLDALRSTAPDLVIASVPYRMESLAAILKSGLPVLTLAPHSLSDIDTDIRLIAALVGASSEGEAVVTRVHQALAEARAKAAGVSARPAVYCEEWGKPLIHSQHWVAELIEAAGGTFLGEPGSHTTAAAVGALPEEQQPDVLLFAWCGAGSRVPLKRVIEQRDWHHLRAVRNGRVFCVPDEFFNTPAPTLLEGLRCITGALHPQLYPVHPRLVTMR